MDLPGETYLFNLSLLAITVAVVSALVMLIRQTMGGKLSNFDIYLTVTFISLGFVIAVDAVLPPLVSLFDPPPAVLWAMASGLAAVLLAGVAGNVLASRRKASRAPLPRGVVTLMTGHSIAILLLAANAVIPRLQGAKLHAAALTLSLAILMFGFIRRIASLLGDKPSEDWDPKRS